MKHTHRGHCQACGAIQAIQVRNGMIAKHGYKVAGFGFFNGVCMASERLPMEQSIDVTVQIIDQLQKRIVLNEKLVVDYKAGSIRPIEVRVGSERYRSPRGELLRRDVMVPWAQAEAYQQEEQVARMVRELESDTDHSKFHIEVLQGLMKRVHGQPLIQVEEKAPIVLIEGMDLGNGFTLISTMPRDGGYRRLPYYPVRHPDGSMRRWTKRDISKALEAK